MRPNLEGFMIIRTALHDAPATLSYVYGKNNNEADG